MNTADHHMLQISFGCGSFIAALDGSNLDHLTSLSLGREGGTGFGMTPSA